MKTTKNFSEQYKIIYDIFLRQFASNSIKASLRGFCEFLNISLGKRQAWQERGQWPSAEDLETLHKKMGFCYKWLVTGEGDPFESSQADKPNPPVTLNTPQQQAVPLIGFAECGVIGWKGVMTIPVTVDMPEWREGMFAVMASGDSMLPAGIGNGHVCYCDPSKAPAQGDAVFVEQIDGTGAIKLFCGRSERGGCGTVELTGWLDLEEGADLQKPFNLSIAASAIKRLAPVVCVRRRL